MQDILGDWHDWLKLTEKAETLLGTVPEIPLVSALHTITRTKFRKAIDVLAETRIALSARKPAAGETSVRQSAAA